MYYCGLLTSKVANPSLWGVLPGLESLEDDDCTKQCSVMVNEVLTSFSLCLYDLII